MKRTSSLNALLNEYTVTPIANAANDLYAARPEGRLMIMPIRFGLVIFTAENSLFEFMTHLAPGLTVRVTFVGFRQMKPESVERTDERWLHWEKH